MTREKEHFLLRKWARELLKGEVMDVVRMYGQEAANKVFRNLLMEVIDYSNIA